MPTFRSTSTILEGTAFEVQGTYVMIGSEADNTVRLQHPSVSAHHAILTVGDGDFKLWDLHSAGGIKVNGKPAVVAYLQDGDQVSFGEVELRFEASAEAARTAHAPAPPPPVREKPVTEPVAEAGTPAPVEPPRPGPLVPFPALPPQPAARVIRPEIQTPLPAAPAPADTPDNPPPIIDQQEQPVRVKISIPAVVRRMGWALVFLGGIAVFVLGNNRSNHALNFIGLVMMIFSAGALFVSLRCGNLVAPPRSRNGSAVRR